MTDYEYDPDLPYVVAWSKNGDLVARFARRCDADHACKLAFAARVIDTTPKPRVPEDAEFITWIGSSIRGISSGIRWFAKRDGDGWQDDNDGLCTRLEELPGVTPDTVFTVLKEVS
ncbi:MAG: hypothetical protein ACTH7X_08745 [Brevibacterium aurantiacum]